MVIISQIELNNIYNMDCLKGMKLIDDNSIDLIVTDPPYNIGKAEWDKIDNYIEWCGEWISQCERVLKDNGSFYFWQNDFEQMAELQHWIKQNTEFKFKSFNIWDKGDFRALSWKNPSCDSNLRKWFETTEYCLFYTFQDKTGLKQIDKEFIAPKNPFKKELIKARNLAGMSITEIAEKGNFYGDINHGGAVTNWEKGYNVPLKEQWELMKTFLPIKREYEDLRQEYEDLRYTHNLDKNHNNVWKSNHRNNGERHPTEKPIDIIKRIIKTSSNENDIVLDLFMGSGTTSIASLNLGRNFVGFEKNKNYYNLSIKRLAKFDKKYLEVLPDEEKPAKLQLF